MDVTSAIALVTSIVYRPGWVFEATDHTNRFEGSISLKITYPAQNTNRDQAANGYPESITTYASFPLIVRDCDDTSLYRKILDAVLEIEAHEAREFFRVCPTFWAPFHPHRVDGMARWHGAVTTDALMRDLQFGIA